MVGLCCIWHDIRIQVDTHNLVFKKPSSSSTTLSSPFSVSLPALPSTPVSTTQLSPIPSPTPPIPIQSPSTTASSSIPAQTPSTTSTSDSNLTLLGVVVNVAQPVKWGGMSFGATGGSLLSALGMGPLSLTRHWISCRSVDDTWYAFDSTHSTPDLIGTVVEAAAFLNACIKVGATVIKVFKKSRKDHTDDNDWVHVENGSS
ncbi:hypothetical protein Pelo_6633 [Pelomyxa schiedti]|nr:hypothetical protein Pelo_6633 [Pelomyxa schiedti]